MGLSAREKAFISILLLVIGYFIVGFIGLFVALILLVVLYKLNKNKPKTEPESKEQKINVQLLSKKSKDKLLIHTRINGLRHYCTPKYLDKLLVGDKLILELDKNNRFDKHAVKVINEKDNHHLGYIPANFNKRKGIWRKIEEGRLKNCYVENRFRNNQPKWLNSHSVYIDIKLKN